MLTPKRSQTGWEHHQLKTNTIPHEAVLKDAYQPKKTRLFCMLLLLHIQAAQEHPRQEHQLQPAPFLAAARGHHRGTNSCTKVDQQLHQVMLL